jgi:hypothetical protein
MPAMNSVAVGLVLRRSDQGKIGSEVLART